MEIKFENDKVYDITFIKKDGTKRDMLCTLNPKVLPETKGKGRNLPNHLKTVFDLEKNDWRTINLNTIERFEIIE